MQGNNEGRAHMQFLLTATTPMIIVTIWLIYWYLLQIEVNKTISLPTGLESVGTHEDFAKKKSGETKEGLEEESEKPEEDTIEVTEEEEDKPRRYRVGRFRMLILFLTSLGLSLLTYLLLVVSSLGLLLSLAGVATVIAFGLHQQIAEELRRQRLDRIVAIITLIFLSASFMSLATYARKTIQEGEVYQGKARIIGFDLESYSNSEEDSVTRTDLQVAWGGEWGCPQEGGKQCTGFVQGAMCESEEQNDRKFRRYLEDGNDGNDANDEDEDAQEEEELEEENEDLEEDLEDEEEEVEEEEEELDEEEEENEELEEELEEYEEYAEDLEEEVIDVEEGAYYYDDDLVYDEYWNDQDWGSVWGEYACYDLFDYDISGSTYNADEKPGDDDWPFVNIYGNCRTCDAYIVDYFSTEHFQQIHSFKTQGRNYLIFSLFGIALSAMLHFKHRMDPIAERELELLPNDGGAMA